MKIPLEKNVSFLYSKEQRKIKMEKLKTALDNLHSSLKKLEEAVVIATRQKNENREKIESLHAAVVTAYERIDKAIAQVKEE